MMMLSDILLNIKTESVLGSLEHPVDTLIFDSRQANSYSVFFASFLHYPGLLTLPGQILFAYFSYIVYTEAHKLRALTSNRNVVSSAH